MAKVLNQLPELDGNEFKYVWNIIEDLDDNQASEFAAQYRKKRRGPNSIFLLILLGLIGIAGIHRFRFGKFGTGVMYLMTPGFVFAGKLYGLLADEKVVFKHNKFVASSADTNV